MTGATGAAPRAAAAVLGLALLAAAVWVHRIEIDRPASHAELLQADTYRYYYPTAVYLHRELRAGRIPLWNPYQLAGQPYLALHVPAVLYPPNLVLFALLPPLPALAAHAVLHLFVAGLFTWLLAGRLGLSAPARLAAAAAFLLAPPLRLGFYMTPFLSTPAWLPALLWAIHGVASDGRGRWALALAAALALGFLGGHAQAFVYEVQMAGVYGAFALACVARRRSRLRAAGLALAGAALAFGLVAPQLLPSLELTAQAVRGLGGVTYAEAALPTVFPAGLAAGILRWLPAEQAGPHAPLVALPALALPLALAGLLAPRLRGHQALFLASAACVGCLMLGWHTPAFALYYELPLGNLFRLPSRMAFVWAFLAAMAVGIGIEAVRGRWPARGPRWLPAAAATALALAVGGDLYVRTRTTNAHPAVTGAYAGAPAEVIELLRRDPGRRRVFVETRGVYSTGAIDKFGMMNGVYALPDYEPSMPRAYLDYFRPTANEPWHGRLYAAAGDGAGRSEHLARPRLLDLMSVGFVFVEASAPPALLRALAGATGSGPRRVGRSFVFERRTAVPRAYAVRRVRTAPDLAGALAAIEAEAFRPLEEAVVTGPAPAAPDAPPAAGRDRVEIADYAADRVRLRAECAARCLAILTDLHYPGWRAEVDGRDAPIVATNAIFRGVWLEPGAHEVVYRFAPASLRAGLGLFGAALVAVGAGVALGPARARLRGRRGP
jgi:hypothetical protein